MRHLWNRDTVRGVGTCRRCGTQAKLYLLKRGGMPPCNPPKINYATPLCTSTLNPETTALKHPPITCYGCPGRLKQSLCKGMIRAYVATLNAVGGLNKKA